MDVERSLIVSGGLDENIHIWNYKEAKRRAVIPEVHRCATSVMALPCVLCVVRTWRATCAHRRGLRCGVFSTQIHQNTVVSCGGRDSHLKVSDLETQKVIRQFAVRCALRTVMHTASRACE